MIIWAACDSFAMMMTDRRVLKSYVVANADGSGSTFGEQTQGEDAAKAFLSQDRRDIYAVAGTTSQPYAERATRFHGVQADEAILNSVRPKGPLQSALDTDLLPHSNTILHSYAHAGKIVCCRHEWSPTSLSRGFLVAPANQVIVNAAGVGAGYVEAFVHADPTGWAEVIKRVDDSRPLRAYLRKFFEAVSRLHLGVSAEADTWILTKADATWSEIEGDIRGI